MEQAVPLRKLRCKKPRLFLVHFHGRAYVFKDVAHMRGWRRLLARWLLRREERAYRELSGLHGIPRCYGFVDRDALLLSYLDGEVLRRESVSLQASDYFESLREIVASIHQRGYLHLDLGHRSNLLVLKDGSPGIVDFGSAILFASPPLLGWLGQWVDLRSVRRLETRYGRQDETLDTGLARAKEGACAAEALKRGA
ncbi:MAG: hypothetical protein ACE5F1_20520 [Planctomycetota bacterium]